MELMIVRKGVISSHGAYVGKSPGKFVQYVADLPVEKYYGPGAILSSASKRAIFYIASFIL